MLAGLKDSKGRNCSRIVGKLFQSFHDGVIMGVGVRGEGLAYFCSMSGVIHVAAVLGVVVVSGSSSGVS